MRILVAATAALAGVSAQNVTTCWAIDAADSLQEALASYSGPACAVDVIFPVLASSYAPNQNVALLWGVQVDNYSSNVLGVPMPPDAMPTLSVDHLNQDVQILATYVRVCKSIMQCAPTLLDNDTYTKAQSGNFSSTADATYFQSTDEISFADAGNYTVAAVAVLGNAENRTMQYYFQAFAEIVVEEVYVAEPDYDKTTTYCRVTTQEPLDDQLNASVILESSDSCEIDLAIDTGSVVQADQLVNISWTATLARNDSKEIQLPDPLVALEVSGDAKSGESGYYTIVRSVLKLCERGMECTEYSDTVNLTSSVFSANFSSDSTATFTASDLVLPSAGWYDGFVQITLGGVESQAQQRYDFVTYFDILATTDNLTEEVESERYVNDASKSYCWEVVADVFEKDVDASDVAFVGSGTICPYTMTMKVSTTSLTVDTGAQVNWAVAEELFYEATEGLTVNLTSVYDEEMGELVNVPIVDIYYCTDSTCSPFSKNKTLVYSATATNFTGSIGAAAFFSPDISLPEEGTYALMAHAVIPNGDGLRFDVATFQRMTVSSASTAAAKKSTSTSKVGLIMGMCVGGVAVVGLGVVGAAFLRRKAERETVKTRRYSFFNFRPMSNTNELPTASGHASDDSGSFMYVKAQRSPGDGPRFSSLSYDPYSRRSFLEADGERSDFSFGLSESDLEFPMEITPTHVSTQLTPARPQL